MTEILLVGYGYLGSYLAGQLQRDGYSVAVASRHGGEGVLDVDLGDAASVARLSRSLAKSPSWVIHCASSSRGGPEAYRRVFVDGVRHLRDTFPRARILLTSSTSVYGQIDGSEVTEESPAEPARETGRCLIEAERHVCESGGIVLRLAGIYGPHRAVHLERMLEGTARIESGEVSRFLNQIHRDDAAGAISHLIGRNRPEDAGGVFNVSDDRPITQRECYEELARLLQLPVPGEQPPDLDRKRAWTHKRVSNTKLRATGWQPLFPSFICAVRDDERLLGSLRE